MHRICLLYTSFMTQPIYSDEEVEKLGRMKQELNTKILCGIMPLVSYRNAMFIKNEMPGIQVPDEIVAQYRPDMSRAEAEDVAVRISQMCIRDSYYAVQHGTWGS